MQINELLSAMKEREALDARIFALSNSVKQEMIERGLETIESKRGKLEIKPKRRRKKQTSSQEIDEIQEAIELEKAELQDANAKQIYELQKTRDMAEIKMLSLLHNEWIEELENKLKDVKRNTISETPEPELELAIKLSEPSINQLVDDAWLSNALKQAKAAKPKAMTKSQVTSFVRSYFKGYYEGDLDTAFQQRLDEHIAHWEAKSI